MLSVPILKHITVSVPILGIYGNLGQTERKVVSLSFAHIS